MNDVTPRPKASKPRKNSRQRAESLRSKQAEVAAKAEVILRSGGWCEVRIDGICLGRANQVHHLVRGSGRVHDPELMRHSCGSLNGSPDGCHDHIHRNVAEAYRRGWLIKHEGKAS